MPESLDLAQEIPVVLKENLNIRIYLEAPEIIEDQLNQQLEILGKLKQKYIGKTPLHQVIGKLVPCFADYVMPQNLTGGGKKLKAIVIEENLLSLIDALYIFIDIKGRSERESTGGFTALDVAKEMLSNVSSVRAYFDACFRMKKNGAKMWRQILENVHDGKDSPRDGKTTNIFKDIGSLLSDDIAPEVLYNALKEDNEDLRRVASIIREQLDCVLSGARAGADIDEKVKRVINEMQSDISLVRAFLDSFFRMNGNLVQWRKLLEKIEEDENLREKDSLREPLGIASEKLGYNVNMSGLIYSALKGKKRKSLRDVAKRIRANLSKAVKLRDSIRKSQ